MDNSYIGPIGTKVESTCYLDDGMGIGEFCGYATIVDSSGTKATACWTIPVIKFEIMEMGSWTTEYRLIDTEYLEVVKDDN